MLRAKTSLLAPFHGGTANAALSVAEDFSTIIGLGISIFVSALAFIVILIAVAIAFFLTISLIRKGIKLFDFLKNRHKYKPSSLTTK